MVKRARRSSVSRRRASVAEGNVDAAEPCAMTDQAHADAMPTRESAVAAVHLGELERRVLAGELSDRLATVEQVLRILVRNSSRRAKREILAILNDQEDTDA
jgi:hypothetical protein